MANIIRSDASFRPAKEKLQPSDKFGAKQYDPNQVDWIEIAQDIDASDQWTLEFVDTSNGSIVDLLKVGDKIRLKQTDSADYKYYFVVLAYSFLGTNYFSLMKAGTAVTTSNDVAVSIDPALAVTNLAYSRAKLPLGFPTTSSFYRYGSYDTSLGQTFSSSNLSQMRILMIDNLFLVRGSSGIFTLGGSAAATITIELVNVDADRSLFGAQRQSTYIIEGGTKTPAWNYMSGPGLGTPMKLVFEKQDGTNFAAGSVELIPTINDYVYNVTQ